MRVDTVCEGVGNVNGIFCTAGRSHDLTGDDAIARRSIWLTTVSSEFSNRTDPERSLNHENTAATLQGLYV